ncbi:hypothetical protein B0H63DRAFT_379070, partial [Podospora didyma]
LIPWTGGPLAILLQFAAPGIAAGSCAHSRFATHPISRLRRTSAFIFAISHGTSRQRDAIIGAVKKQHAFVRGPGYDASDAELQKWTAVTMLFAGLRAHAVLGKGVSERDREVLWRWGFGRFAMALDMPAEMWPRSWDEMERYYLAKIETLEITPAARRAARIFLYELTLPWWLRCMGMLPAMRLVMARWLPPRLRREYGLPDPDGRLAWLGYVVLVWVARVVLWVLPRRAERALGEGMRRDMVRAAEDIARFGRWMI